MYCDNRVIADLTKMFTVHGIASKYYVYNVSVRNWSHVVTEDKYRTPKAVAVSDAQRGAGSNPTYAQPVS